MPRGERIWWAGALALGVFAYLFSLGGIHIPKIGDEYVYLQITRVIAEQDWILPVATDEGPWSTKPPMLFWQGWLTTALLGHDLFTIRLPIVLYTMATAALAFRFARRAGGSTRAGIVAALSYLVFFSTFRYGRAYLTNAPEVFFSFAAIYAVAWWREDGAGLRASLAKWGVVGLFLGLVALYRSVRAGGALRGLRRAVALPRARVPDRRAPAP